MPFHTVKHLNGYVQAYNRRSLPVISQHLDIGNAILGMFSYEDLDEWVHCLIVCILWLEDPNSVTFHHVLDGLMELPLKY